MYIFYDFACSVQQIDYTHSRLSTARHGYGVAKDMAKVLPLRGAILCLGMMETFLLSIFVAKRNIWWRMLQGDVKQLVNPEPVCATSDTL